ncbi:phage scaffolding protein [Mycoplasmatota bacterium]|nr:phage scaffolding protein [Mycoplasmatota bacterium]
MEKLKQLLGEDLFKQVSEKIGSNKYIFGLAENYIARTRFDEVNNAKNEFEKQVKEYNKKVEDLTKSAKSTEELNTQLATLKADFEKKEVDYQTRLKETRENTALKMAFNGKVHDVDYAISQVDKSKLKFDENGNITEGLDDQLKTLKESKSFLFVPEKKDVPNPFGFKKIGGDPNQNPPQHQEPKGIAEALAFTIQGGE